MPGRDPFDPLDGIVTETLDLHRWTSVQVRDQLPSYLRGAQRRQPGALLHLITGKGRRSAHGPVLKPLVRRLLSTGLAPQVAAWGPDDDEGGFLVRLRR